KNAGRPDRTYQWNVSLQREFTRNLVLEVAYIANRNIWQGAAVFQDFNAIGVDTLKRFGFTVGDLNDATLLNSTLSAALANPTQASTLAARGIVLPYPSLQKSQ